MTTSNEHNNAPGVPQGEPVAWKYELAVRIDADGRGSGWCWHLTDYKPSVPDGMIRNLRPLTYADATPAPVPAQEVGLNDSKAHQLPCGESSINPAMTDCIGMGWPICRTCNHAIAALRAKGGK